MERAGERNEHAVTSPAPAQAHSPAPPPSRSRLVWLLAVFFLIQKGTNNVLYLTWLAGLLKHLGSTMLPWAYLAGNISFIALQYAFVRRMVGREGHWMLSTLSLPVVGFSIVTALVVGSDAGPVLLAGVVGGMVVDLLTNQAFAAMANQLLSLQEAKRRLPAIYGAGSIGYILSGIIMKTVLDFAGIGPLVWLNTAILCIGAFVLQQIGRHDHGRPGSETAAAGQPAREADAPPPVPSIRQPLAALLLASSVLIVFNRFLIDYLFSASVTAHFGDATDIASFLGLFGAAADFTVVILQMTVMNWVFASMPIGRILLLTPFLLTGLCLAASFHPALPVVAVTQFVVLLNSKNFTVPATTLLLGAFPANARGSYRRDISTISSAASIAASVVLLVARDLVPIGGLFVLAGLCYGGLLLVHFRLDHGYAATLRETLAGTGAAPDDETLRSIGFLPEGERLLRLRELLVHSDPQVRFEAVQEIERLPDDPLRQLVFPRLSGETNPRCLTALARLAVERFGPEAVSHTARLLQTADDPRLQADLLEALGRTNGGLPVEELAAMYLEHDHHRVRGSAVLALLRLARDASGIEAALGTLSRMARAQEPPFRSAAAAVMGETALPLFLDSIETLANDPDRDVALIAIRSLGRLPTSGGLAALGRLSGHADPARAGLAKRFIENSSRERLARLRSLMDGLTAAERQKLSHTIRSIGATAGLDIVSRILRLEQADAREGLMRLLDPASPDTVEMLRATLIGRAQPDETPSLDPVWNWCRIPRAAELPGWAPAIPLLNRVITCAQPDASGRGAGPGALTLLHLLIREAELLACIRRGEHAGWSSSDAETAVSRWIERALLCCRMVLLAAPRPETLLSAFDRLRSSDSFTSSVAQELLETNLPHEISEPLLLIHQRLKDLGGVPGPALEGRAAEPLSSEEESALFAYLRPQENPT